MTARRRLVLTVVVATFGLVAAGCGDAETATDAPPESTTTTAADTDASTTVDDATSTTTAPTTTTPTSTTAPAPPGLALDDIPDLVARWGDGTGDPLELAQAIIGFPLPIPTPDNTTAHAISVDRFGGSPDTPWLWDWSYEVLSSDPMPEIDIYADEDSPGHVALREFYDPIMADLGWSYSNSTGSDPSSGAGGPQSINHVYQSDDETIVVDGLAATPKPVFVWAAESQVFDGGVPGYQVDVPLELPPSVIPVPLIQAIIDNAPEIDGELADVRLLSWTRSEDSFDAERGLRYLEVSLEWTLTPSTAEATKAAFSTDLADAAFLAGSESFFDPGVFEPEEPREFEDDWTQPLVFIDRYTSAADITGDDATGALLELSVRFESDVAILAPPES